MDFLLAGVVEALRLIVRLDGEILEIVRLSLTVSGLAVVIAACLGIPLGSLLALSRFRAKGFIAAIINTAMGLPPVVVGLTVVLVLARRGPLGDLGLLLTSRGMVLAQVVIATPIVAGITMAALQALDPNLRFQVVALGATKFQMARSLLWEARLGLLSAVMAGFGRVCAEVGAVMMVGGNLRHETRVLTTAIVLEARQGNYERAMALGLILLCLAFAVNAFLTALQQKAGRL